MHEIKWFICVRDPQIDDLEVRIQRSQVWIQDPGVRNHPFWMVSGGLCQLYLTLAKTAKLVVWSRTPYLAPSGLEPIIGVHSGDP